LSAQDAGTAASSKLDRPGYRPEVQGLRAFAVLMVVAYHVWLGRVSGGVDVFLLISAFLLTLSFTRKLDAGVPLHLAAYWLNLFRRLLPAVVVVLLALLAGSALLLPQSRWPDIFGQAWASLGYVQNWLLAADAVNYYARDHSDASPLQHFWSLSIQGQVFILWPLIFAAVSLAARRFRSRHRRTLAAVFGAVFAASLAFSIWQTEASQAQAYFDTRARLWEFALGSLLALAVPYLRPGRALRVALGWFGLVAMLSCGFLLQVEQQFPGYIALWPTLAAGCVIIAGQSGSRFGVDRLLGVRPLAALGDNSYALYLWHWPIMVLWLILADKPGAGMVDGTAIVLASLLLAVLTTRLVETPVRTWHWPSVRRRRVALVVVAGLAAVAVPLSGWQYQVHAQEEAANRQPLSDNPGALSLVPGFKFSGDRDALVRPAVSSLDTEWADDDGPCRGAYAPEDPAIGSCREAGNPSGAVKTIVVLGDSHAQMWMSALGEIARAHNWYVALVHEPGCRYGAFVEDRKASCNEFNQAARDYALRHAPDAVLTVASRTSWSSPEETLAEGYLEGIQPFLDAEIRVVALRDTPRFDYNMAECIELHSMDPRPCAPARSEVLARVSPLKELRERRPQVGVMDMTELVCTGSTCPGLIGNVLVYMDKDHLTKTYVRTTITGFEQRFLRAAGWRQETEPAFAHLVGAPRAPDTGIGLP
jgi:peptidoglycan/LPS O-acetylase OafA/YrhL